MLMVDSEVQDELEEWAAYRKSKANGAVRPIQTVASSFPPGFRLLPNHTDKNGTCRSTIRLDISSKPA